MRYPVNPCCPRFATAAKSQPDSCGAPHGHALKPQKLTQPQQPQQPRRPRKPREARTPGRGPRNRRKPPKFFKSHRSAVVPGRVPQPSTERPIWQSQGCSLHIGRPAAPAGNRETAKPLLPGPDKVSSWPGYEVTLPAAAARLRCRAPRPAPGADQCITGISSRAVVQDRWPGRRAPAPADPLGTSNKRPTSAAPPTPVPTPAPRRVGPHRCRRPSPCRPCRRPCRRLAARRS